MLFISTSDCARELGARPRAISELFYQRILDDEICSVIPNRRLIPRSYVPVIKEALTSRGRLLSQQEAPESAEDDLQNSQRPPHAPVPAPSTSEESVGAECSDSGRAQ